MIGLEPTRRKAPDPKSGMATNYITSAWCREGIFFFKKYQTKKAPINQGFLTEYFNFLLFNLHFFGNTVLAACNSIEIYSG